MEKPTEVGRERTTGQSLLEHEDARLQQHGEPDRERHHSGTERCKRRIEASSGPAHACRTAACSFRRARDSRDITVPMGMRAMSAISL
jgi:hypothetical protein